MGRSIYIPFFRFYKFQDGPCFSTIFTHPRRRRKRPGRHSTDLQAFTTALKAGNLYPRVIGSKFSLIKLLNGVDVLAFMVCTGTTIKTDTVKLPAT